VPASALDSTARTLVAGGGTVRQDPVLGVDVAGDARGRALADVTLVTAEAARISEFSVATGGETVARFRADGVVVATPAGSAGYARRIDAPVVAPETGVAAVVPIAPFAIDADHWVVPLDDVTVRVERDEATVQLMADDRTLGQVDPGTQVTIRPVDSLPLLSVPASASHFPADS